MTKKKAYVAIIGFCIVLLAVCIVKLVGLHTKNNETPKIATAESEYGIVTKKQDTKEVKAVWLYFEEMEKKATSEAKWKSFIDRTFDVCKSKSMNTVIIQVRPFADAMYPSKYYPWSVYATGTVGKNPGFDPLKYAVTAAHKRGLSIQAWINPYRIAYTTKVSSLSTNSIARKWKKSDKAWERRNVLSVNGSLYFNPASKEVQKLVVNGVKEIVKNYQVDGIHMDDYFYPNLGSKNYKKFDYPEYQTYKKNANAAGEKIVSLVAWRRANVDTMVRKIYQAVKSIDKDCVFGISPAGNIENLYSKTAYYSDVKKWMNSDKYIDYICPQIYWSFTQKTAPYKKMVDEWVALPRNKQVGIYIGLAGYRAGISKKSAKALYDIGWSQSNTILKRQVLYGRTKNVDGFAVFSWNSLTDTRAKKEIKNLVSVLKLAK